MSFARALEENPIPRRLGGVRLRYESSLLIVESRPRLGASGLLPESLLVGGLACALSGVTLLLQGSSERDVALAGVLAGATGLLIAGGVLAARRGRARRRFVLNFATESLRLDLPTAAASRSTVVHFDGVTDVAVVPRRDGTFTLAVTYLPAPGAAPVTEVLIDRVSSRDVPHLRRVWRLLRGAFGLRAPGPGP